MRRLLVIALIAGASAACAGGTLRRPVHGRGQIGISSAVASDRQAPELPDLARRHTGDGAAAFAGYYFKAINWAIATDDWVPALLVTAPNCSGCTRFRHGLEQLRASDDRVREERIVVDSTVIEYLQSSSGAQFGVDVEIHMSGGPDDGTDSPQIPLTVWLEWRHGRWAVSALERNS